MECIGCVGPPCWDMNANQGASRLNEERSCCRSGFIKGELFVLAFGTCMGSGFFSVDRSALTSFMEEAI